MINPKRRILQAISLLLHETITYGGTDIPFYTDAPPNADGLYILASGDTQAEIGTKTRFVNRATLLLEVVERQNPQFVNTRGMDYVTGEVMRLMKPNPMSLLNLYPEFGCISVSLESSPLDDRSLLAAEGVTRILMRWRFHIEEGYQVAFLNAGYTVENTTCVNQELERLSEL